MLNYTLKRLIWTTKGARYFLTPFLVMSKKGGLQVAIKIKVSNPSFNGFRGGVRFYNGEATFEEEAKGRRIAEALGYEIIELNTPKKATSTKKPTRKNTSKKMEEGVK